MKSPTSLSARRGIQGRSGQQCGRPRRASAMAVQFVPANTGSISYRLRDREFPKRCGKRACASGASLSPTNRAVIFPSAQSTTPTLRGLHPKRVGNILREQIAWRIHRNKTPVTVPFCYCRELIAVAVQDATRVVFSVDQELFRGICVVARNQMFFDYCPRRYP